MKIYNQPTKKARRKFKLHGQTIKIEYDPKLSDTDDVTGLSIYRENKIKLLPKSEGNSRTGDSIEATFYHELIHFIMYFAGEDELRINEKFIDIVSGLLHQALVTMEYDND